MQNIRPSKSFLILAGCWALFLPLYGAWLWLDQVTAPWDMSIHARCAFRYWEELKGGGLLQFYRLSNYYPPLFHILAAPLTPFSSHPDVYCIANWLALLATMWATWRLGRELAGDEAGLAAGMLIPGFLSITWLCCQPMVDITLTATVAATLWLLVREGNLAYSAIRNPQSAISNLQYAIEAERQGGRGRPRSQAHALGLAIALGMLAKWPYAFFTTVPIALYLIKELLAARRVGAMDAYWRGFGWVCLWPLLLAAPWYVISLPSLVGKVGHQLVDIPADFGLPPLWSLTNLSYYAGILEQEYLRAPLTALLALGAALLWVRARRARASAPSPQRAWGWTVLGVAIVSGYGIMTMISNKTPRYVMPLTPALAVVATHWVGLLKTRRARACAVAAVAALALGMAAWGLFGLYPPDRRDWGVEQVAERIVERGAKGRRIAVLVIPNEWQLNATALDFALYRRDRRYGATLAKTRLGEKDLDKYRYVVLTEPAGENSFVSRVQVENTQLAARAAGWEACERVKRSDGRTIVVLKKKER